LGRIASGYPGRQVLKREIAAQADGIKLPDAVSALTTKSIVKFVIAPFVKDL